MKKDIKQLGQVTRMISGELRTWDNDMLSAVVKRWVDVGELAASELRSRGLDKGGKKK